MAATFLKNLKTNQMVKGYEAELLKRTRKFSLKTKKKVGEAFGHSFVN